MDSNLSSGSRPDGAEGNPTRHHRGPAMKWTSEPVLASETPGGTFHHFSWEFAPNDRWRPSPDHRRGGLGMNLARGSHVGAWHHHGVGGSHTGGDHTEWAAATPGLPSSVANALYCVSWFEQGNLTGSLDRPNRYKSPHNDPDLLCCLSFLSLPTQPLCHGQNRLLAISHTTL